MEQIQNNPYKTQIADPKIETPEVLIPTRNTALPPVATVDFSNPEIVANNIDVRTDWVQYNAYYGNSWLLHYNSLSSIEADFDLKKLEDRSYSLDLVHLSSLVGGQPLSQITIEVNGQVVVTNHNPNDGNYIRESFDITKYLKDGTNTVRISLDDNAQSNYWIQYLAIQAH